MLAQDYVAIGTTRRRSWASFWRRLRNQLENRVSSLWSSINANKPNQEHVVILFFVANVPEANRGQHEWLVLLEVRDRPHNRVDTKNPHSTHHDHNHRRSPTRNMQHLQHDSEPPQDQGRQDRTCTQKAHPHSESVSGTCNCIFFSCDLWVALLWVSLPSFRVACVCL